MSVPVQSDDEKHDQPLLKRRYWENECIRPQKTAAQVVGHRYILGAH